MKTKPLFAAALLLSAGALARPAFAEAAPRSWALGWEGLGNVYATGSPGVRYVWTDKTAFELVPTVLVQHSNTGSASAFSGETVMDTKSYALAFDVIRKIGTYQGVSLSWLAEPSIGIGRIYQYSTGTFAPGNTHTSTTNYGLGLGLELEYFVLPNLSLGSRALVTGTLIQSNVDTDNGLGVTKSAKNISRSAVLVGQILAIRWYFGQP